jgi:putative heme-binding domain-containing protein
MKQQIPKFEFIRNCGSKTSSHGTHSSNPCHASQLLWGFCNWALNPRSFVGVCFLMFGAASILGAQRPPWTSNRVVGSPNPPAPYNVERLYLKLAFNRPVDIGTIPGTDRLFVLEQNGKLFSFPSRPDVERADLAFDFRSHHRPFDSSYSIAFHPKFAENGFMFVCYAEPSGRTNGSIISRFKLNLTDPPAVDAASEKVIFTWLSGGHNGCTLAFGKDGFLYISTGDASNPDPPDAPYKTGQDISDVLSSILRIDVDHSEGAKAYANPPDNPFLNIPGARPEVWAFGFRNPWRMSFDSATGDLWVGDVGWELWEMIHRVKAGGNYGWSLVEGPNTHVRTDVPQGPGPILPPLVSLPHSDAASITGGRVYHGQKLAKLRDAYVYGDWETGKFWALRHEGDKLTSNDELCDTTLKPASFGEDREGELLILDYNGGIYGFAPNTAPPANLAFPRRLSETGLYQNVESLAPAPGVVGYRINAEMWNDYAAADRLVGIPGDGAIATSGGRETIAGRMWFFPSNTVFARTLTLEMERGQPSSRRRIETQLMHFEGQTWNAYTFRWNSAQTDADLVPSEGTNDLFTVRDAAAPGGRREIPWRFVSRAECFRCHNVWAGDLLSFNWPQLSSPGAASELQRLEELGVLRGRNQPRSAARLVNPHDTSLDLANRARSWLHVNCAGCHRFGAGAGVPAQFNIDQALDKSRTYDEKPVRGDFGIQGARIIAPGDPFRATLLYRIVTEGSGHMPHIGSRLADEAGGRLVRDWIRSLPVTESEDASLVASQKLTEQNAALLRLLLTLSQGEQRAEVIRRLLASTSGCLALLDHVSSAAAGTTPAAPEELNRLRVEVTSVAKAHTNTIVRDLFQRLLPPGERRRTLGNDVSPDTVLALKGDAAHGKDLFLGAAQCSRCHICDGAGRAFGPDLTGIATKYSRNQLLEQILAPSKIIAPEFKTANILLRDDTEVSGFVLKATAAELVLRDETLSDRHVKLSDVKERRESALSAMPEGLLAPLTAQEAADLLEYLSTTKLPQRSSK